MRLRPLVLALSVLGAAAPLLGQAKVTINVGGAAGQPFSTAWAYFGYDEPNYTYAANGRKLLAELSCLSPVPVSIRMHNLLTSGNGEGALKWGSTNVYTEDASGHAIYDWTILDRIFDTLLAAKARPLVEIGFMPEALSTHPQPYRHDWPNGPLWTGWAYPPRDYQKWEELVYRWVRHALERYGEDEVRTWNWEVWNEPDIAYWQGTWEEYYRLYDHAVRAVKRACPEARVGGPDSTGPADAKAANFLRQFLEHCARGTNFATGTRGAPLDFIIFHAKGNPSLVNGQVRMGIRRHLESVAEGFRIVSTFPEFKGLPIILGESDPEGCAACSARRYPQNAYRNGPLYACYTAEVLARAQELAARYGVNLAGVVTWAFEFEGQPYFEGFRSLATNGIDKPVLNVFRMFGKMDGRQLPVVVDAALPLDSILRSGVVGAPDVEALSTLGKDKLSVLVWNYQDDEIPAPAASVELILQNLPAGARHLRVHQYRIDQKDSNAFSAWREMGSPQHPDPTQYGRLERAGDLQEIPAPPPRQAQNEEWRMTLDLPRHAVSLLEIAW
ncbi:MAG: beta-xylosidase [Acidobacteriia bacterium]|nr:beta-xylosidase [Terriglobia bacterium]